METKLHIVFAASILMWTHLVEALLNGAAILLGPLMVVVALGAGLALLNRLFHPSREAYRPHSGPRSL
jgi:hypothetical protein